jgi:hypothetical protein
MKASNEALERAAVNQALTEKGIPLPKHVLRESGVEYTHDRVTGEENHWFRFRYRWYHKPTEATGVKEVWVSPCIHNQPPPKEVTSWAAWKNLLTLLARWSESKHWRYTEEE